MRTPIEKPVLNSAKYELVTGFIAIVVGGLGIPFYIEATSKAGWKDESSSIAANVPSIVLFTKGSLDYLYGLIQKGDYAKAAIIVIGAAVLYSPQVLISVMESTYSRPMTAFAATATGLSGTFTSAYAVSQIPEMIQSANAAIQEQFFSPATSEQKADKHNVLVNLKRLIDCVRVSDYRNVDLDFVTRQQLLDLAVNNLAKTAPVPCVESAGYLPSIATGGLGLAFVGLLLYGTLFSYGCGTEKSLRDDFKASAIVAFTASLLLMSFQYLLNFTGGFGVAGGIVDSLGLMNFGRFMPNEKKLGGTLGAALTSAAPVLGVISASFSGEPTKEFSRTCLSSIVKPLLFSGYGDIADYSARFFNAIFAAKFFYFIHTLGVQRYGSEQDRNFLIVLNQLIALEAMVKKTPAENVDKLFSLGDLSDDGAAARVTVNADNVADNANRAVPTINFADLKSASAAFQLKFFGTPAMQSVSSAASMHTQTPPQDSLQTSLLEQS